MTVNEMFPNNRKNEKDVSASNISDTTKTKNTNFSIEHILSQAGKTAKSQTLNNDSGSCFYSDNFSVTYPWLQCTRYMPPRIPRNYKKDVPQRRQLGKHPRIPFTSHQLTILEEKLQNGHYLSTEEVIDLSKKLHLPDVRVKIWFQNRRARERREKHNISDVTEHITKNQNLINVIEEQLTQSPNATSPTVNNDMAMTIASRNNKYATSSSIVFNNGYEFSTKSTNFQIPSTSVNVKIENKRAQINSFD